MKRLRLIGLACLALLPQQAMAAEHTIKVMADEMKFEPAAVEVHAGDTVRFEISNKGELLHEFAVGTSEEHVAHRRMMAAAPTTHDHGSMHGHSHHSPGHDHPQKVVMIEPGRTAVLTVRFERPINLEFACNIPGHYEAGMAGVLAIKPKKGNP